ncbi:MAG: DUF2341 domain-containing protein, partial [Methanomicrobiales archaeon]|nr:DUF2341 domain-containing protein [Methanomicrobiales archaeon]
MERRAVSEVAGTMILIGVVVAGMIIVNLVIIGTPTNTRIPSLQASMTNRSTLITIVHQGGDSIPHGQYKILVDGVDQTGNFMNSGSFPWSIGQTLSYNATTMPHNAIMIYNGTGRGEIVILETKFPWGVYVSGSQGGSGGGGGTTTTLTPTPTLPVLPWYDCSWGYRKNITINRTKVSGTQSDFPVLINLASDTNLSAHALSNGDDIFFTDSDGNKIPHEIESYTSGSGALVAWVKVPSVSSAENTSIFMYYGNSGAPSQQNPTSVWDGNFKGVWHLNNSFSDSTFSHNDGTNQGTTNIAAKIANGRAFDGSSQYITTSSTDLEAATDFTITAWFNPASTSSARHLIWEGNSSANGWGEAIGQLSQEMHISIGNYVDPTLFTNDLSFFRGDTDSGRDTGTLQVSTSFTSINNWHFVAAVVTGMGGSNPSVSLYLNGTSVGTDTGTMARTIDTSQWNTPLQFGKPGADSRYYNGYLDEIRIANTARSVQWIQTEYNNENSPSTFYSIGSEEGSTCPVTPTPTPTPTPSFPWYDCAWGYRKNITIDHAYVPASQTNFPVLVSLSSDSDLSTNALPSGNDILFTKDDGITKIPHEIESYSSGTLVAWVNVSSLSSTTDTVIIMYYGNSGASNQQNAANVWDANFVVVQHMDGSSYTALDDSTGNHNDVTSQIGTPTYLESGRIGYAVGFDGVSAVEIQDSASLDLTYKATVCAWVRSTAVSSYRRIVAKSHTINDFPYTMYGILFDGTHLRHEIASTGTQYIGVGVTDIPSSPAWTYTCGSYDRIALRVYVNGAAEGTPTGLSGDIDTNNMPLSIGRSGFDYDYYIGGIDEVRVSSANRSSTWIATEFANQNDPANFYDVGSEVESACSVTPTPTPTPAPWYDCSWQDRKRITIDHTEVSGTQTDFPVLVSIASDGDISDHAQSDGDDILFT